MTELAKFEARAGAALHALSVRRWANYAEPVALILLCELVAAAFLITTLAKAASDHFWIDEVLANWTARQKSAGDVIAAIWHGSEFSPPTYDLFLHFLFKTFGADRLVARLPSIFAVLASAGMLANLVWRRLGAVSGVLTFGLVLNSFLYEFAIQSRPYAMLMAVTSLALLVLSNRKPETGSWWQGAALAVLLFLAVSLHFYAIITLAVFGLMELLWSLYERRLRLPIWVGMAAGAGASALWLPLMSHLSRYNDGDTAAPDFFGAPTPSNLVRDVHSILVGSDVFLLFIIAVVLLVSAACVAALIFRDAPRVPPKAADGDEAQIAIMGFALLVALPLGYALASYVTHVFVGRYALAASLGAILLFVLALRKVPYQRVVGILLIAGLCIVPLFRAAPRDWSAPALDLLHQARSSGPVVVGDGDLYMELMESAEPALQARLVYLRSPEGLVLGDPSGEHQLERIYRSIRPDFQVKDASPFLAQHPSLLYVARPGRPTDDLSAWFIAQGWVSGVIGVKKGVALFEIKTKPPVR